MSLQAYKLYSCSDLVVSIGCPFYSQMLKRKVGGGIFFNISQKKKKSTVRQKASETRKLIAIKSTLCLWSENKDKQQWPFPTRSPTPGGQIKYWKGERTTRRRRRKPTRRRRLWQRALWCGYRNLCWPPVDWRRWRGGTDHGTTRQRKLTVTVLKGAGTGARLLVLIPFHWMWLVTEEQERARFRISFSLSVCL